MFITIFPVLVLLVGLLAYVLSANPKLQELGRLAYAAGLLVTLFAFSRAVSGFGTVPVVPVLATVIGLLVYALATNPKAQEMGRLSFGCGLLVTLFAFSHAVFRLGAG